MSLDTKFIFTAQDRASGVLQKVSGEFGKLGAAASAARSMMAAVGTIGAGIAAGGAFLSMARGFADASAEIVRLSQLSNVTADEFQRLAAGADTVGIGQERLADIFKDVQDKVGDFLQNGGGPLKDFFENIAHQVGVTAEQFRMLSGPQALELYVSSLQKANISQNEMTFYMEAIASDATLLLPLLVDNARGFKEAGTEAARLGAIIDQETLAASEKFRKEMITLDRELAGAKVSIFGSVIEGLAEVATAFNAARREGLSFLNALQTAGEGKGTIPGQIEFESKRLAALRGRLNENVGPFGGMLTSDARKAMEAEIAQVEAHIAALSRLQLRLTDGMPSVPELSAPAGGGTGRPKSGAGKSKTREEGDPLKPLIDSSLAQDFESLLKDTERLGQVTAEALARDQERLGAAADRWKDVIDPSREYVRQLEEIRDLVATGALTPDQGLAAEFEVQIQMQDKVLGGLQQAKKSISEIDEMTLEAARNIQNTLGKTMYDVLDGNFKDIGRSFGDTLKRMAAEAIAADLGRFVLGDFAKTGKVGGIAGDFFGWLGGMIPSHATGLDYVPYDGYIARLHKGERVQTAKEARSGGGIVVQQSLTFASGVDPNAMGMFARRIQDATLNSLRDARARGDPLFRD